MSISPCRSSAFVAYLLFAMVATAQAPLPKSVSYETYGARLEVVIPDLAHLTGLKLVCTPPMAQTVVVLRLESAPLTETLKRIAHATFGTWVTRNDVCTLYRDNDRIGREQERVRQEHAAAVHSSILRLGAPVTAPGKQADGEEAPAQPGPSDIAARELLSFIDESLIAHLGFNRKLVFSTQPRPLQIGLPGAAMGVAKRMADAASRQSALDESPRTPDRSNEAVRIDFIVIRNVEGAEDGALEMHILGFNPKGEVVIDENAAQAIEPDASAAAADSVGADDPVEPKGHTPLEVSQATKDFFQAQYGRKPVTPLLRQRLLNPVHFEPDVFVGEALVAYARFKHLQLVVAPADEISAASQRYQPEITAEGVEEMLSFGDTVDSGEDGWIELCDEIEEPSPSLMMYSHADRGALLNLMNTVHDVSNPGIPELVRANRAGLNRIENMPQRLLYPGLLKHVEAGQDVIDELSDLLDDQINDLIAGRPLNLAFAPDAYRARFATLMGSSDLMPQVVDEDGNANRAQDYRNEFTEVANAWVPVGSTLRLMVTETTIVDSPVQSNRGTHPIEMGLDAYAWTLLTGRANGKIRLGVQREYDLRHYFAQGEFHSSVVAISSFPPDAQRIPWTELPAKERNELTDAMAKMKQLMDERGVGGQRGRVRP